MWVGKRKIFHGDKSFSSGVPSRSSLDGLLSVGSKVEGDEEQKVRAENSHSGNGSKFLPSASSSVWCPWEVGAGKVGVGSEVDKPQVDDELNDLKHGDVLLPPNADAAGRLEVVPVGMSAVFEMENSHSYQYMTT